MKKTINCSRRFKELAAGLILTAALAVYPSLAAAGAATPDVYGKSIGNWGHAWWQWATNFSSADLPIMQDGNVDCAAGQSGTVWFLAGTFGGTAVRTCSVKQGKALFFPIVNSLFWYPEDCTEVDTCRAKAAAQAIDSVVGWTCTIDGTPCIYTNQVVRDQSDPLPYNIPAYSWVATDAGYTPGPRDFAIADGYWVMLEPLSLGRHTIRFTSAATSPKFALEVTYKLTVTPAR